MIAEETPLSNPAEAELASVQAAARWLVAAAAAIAAALLAGVQLTSLSKLSGQGTTPLLLASTAGTVAFISVGTIVVLAARVLVAPGWTLNNLSHRETEAGNKWQPQWLREALEAQRGLLVPGDELRLSELYRQQRALSRATHELYDKGSVQLPTNLTHPSGPTETYEANNAEHTARLHRRLDNVIAAATRVANAANLVTARRSYRQLVRCLPWAGVVLVASIITFIIATTPTTTAISTPIQMQVQLTRDASAVTQAGLPRSCAGLTVHAVAVGGSLEEPSVVSIDNPQCVLRHQRITSAIGLAVPIASK